MLNMESEIAWKASNKFWENYGKTVVLSEVLKIKKIPPENLEINADVYLKFSEDGLYLVKVGKDENVSVLYEEI